MNVTLYHESGKIEIIEAKNIYHAQNILVYAFLFADEKGKNDVVFGRIENSNIFAFGKSKSLVIRNATDEFLDSCKKLEEGESIESTST